MAGIFLTRVKVFNRAPVPLAVFFDGERNTIPVGHYELPAITLYHAKNQNPIMGSGDAHNPHVSGTQYLVVEEGEEGYGEPLTKDEWEAHCKRPCRWDEEAAFAEKYVNDPHAKLIVRGAKQSSTAKNRYEAGGNPGGLAEFTRKEA